MAVLVEGEKDKNDGRLIHDDSVEGSYRSTNSLNHNQNDVIRTQVFTTTKVALIYFEVLFIQN